MPDSKISELTELITPLAADELAIVDIAAGPITKKVTFSNLMAAVGVGFVTIAGVQTITGQKIFSSADVGAPAAAESELNATNLYLDGKEAIDGGDLFLRLNNASDFSSGVFIPSPLRVDNALRVSNTAGTDFVAMTHDGTNFIANYTNTNRHRFRNLATGVTIEDGAWLRIQDAGNTDYGQFSHGGVDFDLAFVSTVDWNITGATGDMRVQDFADLRLRSGTGLAINSDDNANTAFLFNPGATAASAHTLSSSGPLLVAATNLTVNSPIYILEQAAAAADFATYGQFWVRDDAPNTAMFTDDAGTDFVIGGALLPSGNVADGTAFGDVPRWDNISEYQAALGVQFTATTNPPAAGTAFIEMIGTGTASVDRPAVIHKVGASTSTLWYAERAAASGDGMYSQAQFASSSNKVLIFGNIENGTPTAIFTMRQPAEFLFNLSFFMAEQAAAPKVDNPGEGQVWVRNDVPNVLMFTDDLGTDFQISGSAATLPASAADSSLRGDGSGGWLSDSEINFDIGGNIYLSASSPHLDLRETGATADEGNWIIQANGDEFFIATATDVGPTAVAADVMRVTRTGTVVDQITFPTVVTITSATGAAGDLLEIEDSTDNQRLVVRWDGTSIWQFRDSLAGAGQSWIQLNESSGPVDLLHNGTVKLSTGPLGVDIENNLKVGLATFGSLKLAEGGPAVNEATYGQFFVETETPNLPMFQNDAGDEIILDPSVSEINTQNLDYTLVIGDKGKTIHKASGGAGETITIPANGAVAFRIGTLIGIQNDGGGALSIAITTDTLTSSADNTTGTRTLADGGAAVIEKMTATTWKISGDQMT